MPGSTLSLWKETGWVPTVQQWTVRSALRQEVTMENGHWHHDMVGPQRLTEPEPESMCPEDHLSQDLKAN